MTTDDRHAGWARALDETRTLRAENERLTQELALVNDTLVQRTKAMHRALDRADNADAEVARLSGIVTKRQATGHWTRNGAPQIPPKNAGGGDRG